MVGLKRGHKHGHKRNRVNRTCFLVIPVSPRLALYFCCRNRRVEHQMEPGGGAAGLETGYLNHGGGAWRHKLHAITAATVCSPITFCSHWVCCAVLHRGLLDAVVS